MLNRCYQQGQHAALVKLGLAPPTQTNQVDGGFDQHQGFPWDHSTDVPSENPDAPVLPQEPAFALGKMVGMVPGGSKAAALGLRDMLFFEKMLGPDEAKSMFHGIEQQMSGQGGGVHGTLQITPQGKQLVPMPRPAPRPAAVPPPNVGAQAAHHVISSAPPPMPLRR